MRIIVTGAGSGIGQRVTDELADRGHQLLATDINEAALGDRWPDSVITSKLDVTDVEDWQRVVARADEAWGGVDVLYNIAGYLHPGYVHEIELREIDRHFDINTKGVAYGTCILAKVMVAQGSGHIINIASMAAFAPIGGNALYCASKYAVRALSLAAAADLRDTGVAVTVVCPDAVATPMLDKQKDFKEAALTFTAPRILTADEVAECLIGKVLVERPLEVALPKSRKWLARVVDLFPAVGPKIQPLFERQGLSKQRDAKKEGSSS